MKLKIWSCYLELPELVRRFIGVVIYLSFRILNWLANLTRAKRKSVVTNTYLHPSNTLELSHNLYDLPHYYNNTDCKRLQPKYAKLCSKFDRLSLSIKNTADELAVGGTWQCMNQFQANPWFLFGGKVSQNELSKLIPNLIKPEHKSYGVYSTHTLVIPRNHLYCTLFEL